MVLQIKNRLADSPQCVEKIRCLRIQNKKRDKNLNKPKYKFEKKKNYQYFQRGGLLHELFHVMGVQHTQERPDRDRFENERVHISFNLPTHKHKHKPALHFRHVEVLKENIKDMYEYSYAVCQDCQDYGELRSHSCYGWLTLYPHRGAHYCSSIMPGIIKH